MMDVVKIALGAIALVTSGASMLAMHGLASTVASFPERQALHSVTGRPRHIEPSDYGFYVELAEGKGRFFYSRKSGDETEIVSALGSLPRGEEVVFMYSTQRPVGTKSGRSAFQILEITAPNISRRYDQVKDSWRQDLYLGWAAVGIGHLCALFIAFRLGLSTGAKRPGNQASDG